MRLGPLRWTILGLLFCSTLVNYLDRQTLSVLLPMLREELSLSSADYGMVTMAFLACYTAALIPAGVTVDRIGSRMGLGLSVAVWSLVAMLHAVARGPWSLAVLRGLLGISESGNFPAGTKAIASWFPPERRAFAMAVFDSGAAVGAILAPPLAAMLALHFGWRATFVATGCIGYLVAIGWFWMYHAPERHARLSAHDRETIFREVGVAPAQPAGLGSPLRAIVGQWPLWGLLLTRMAATPVWWFYVFWLPDYLYKGLGLSLKEIGLYGWLPYLASDLGRLTGGAASDRLMRRGRGAMVARKSVMVVGAVAMTAGLRVTGAAGTAEALAWICVATFGVGMWSANVFALHADMFPQDTVGTAFGTTTVGASLGGAIFTYIVGQMVDRVGYTPVFWMVGGLSLTGCAMLFMWTQRPDRAP